ncbi:sodium:proton antiporter NhaD [Marinobacterium arenosum]|uniref:sodium:proton antiporter NhaD n=1 Tax=Marinobacterium arenosum TaxID=2862496 RepID=UPI001C98D3F2|nr:sodium:proton antiporter NhaD [Marinobacterium arenosum]MBY4678992.1 sodium:proton antiporter NhaD [Marinobacterium arenosum]
MRRWIAPLFATFTLLAFGLPAIAGNADSELPWQDFTTSSYGIAALLIFVLAYLLVVSEEFFRLRKSKPVVVAAGFIWVLVGLAYASQGDTVTAGEAVRTNILEYAELFLFLLAAMTFITTLEERRVFACLREWLIARQLSLKSIFWLTGLLSFLLSPVADNLSTALLMGAVLIAVGGHNHRFVGVGCINVVVAANAGGAFSPFGDITTLMVWQQGLVSFAEFLRLFLPALVTWLVPALLMSIALKEGPPGGQSKPEQLKPGAIGIIVLFLATIALAVSVHNWLHMPPVLGMMTGLGVLKVYSLYLERFAPLHWQQGQLSAHPNGRHPISQLSPDEDEVDIIRQFNIFRVVERSSWDTLMFFYGVVLCVGGLSALGYLGHVSGWLYGDLGPTWANILIGVLSAVVDNIPVMFAVLSMEPQMNLNQWLLVTLTAGVGGSLLSIGSAAGIALMGQARGSYTFLIHLRWSWAIALGYIAGIVAHLFLNGT